MHRQLALALLPLVVATSGCGFIVHHPTDDWDGEVVTLPPDQRPTVLVRLGAPADEPSTSFPASWRGTDERAELLDRYQGAFSLPLFSTVAYQIGSEPTAVKADYTLDVSVSKAESSEGSWLSLVGACTLGVLPIPFEQGVSATVYVRDSSGRLLGNTEARDQITTVFWLPALPLNLLFFYDHHEGVGRTLGMNLTVLGAEEAEMFRNLVRHALLAAHEKFHFRRPD